MSLIGELYDKISSVIWGIAIAAPMVVQFVHGIVHSLSMAILGYPII